MYNRSTFFQFLTIKLYIVALTFIAFCPTLTFGQTNPPPDTTQLTKKDTTAFYHKPVKDTSTSLLIKFANKNIILEQTDIVTNVADIYNNTAEDITFTIKVGCPYNWTPLNSDTVTYHTKPGDSAFIPIRIIPSDVKGGADYIINTYLISAKTGAQLASNYFTAGEKKVSRWDVTILPSHKIYFMNHSDTVRFGVNISNYGNQPEDLVLTLKNFMNKSILEDTTGKILRTNYVNTVLRSGSDTTLMFSTKYIGTPLNFQYADLENFSSYSDQNSHNFSIWANTQEARQTDSNNAGYVRGKEIQFAKLDDITMANPFGGQVIPLTADLNAYNILGEQPIMNLYLYGNTILNNNARLFYDANLYYSSYFLQNRLFNGASYYAGYFDTRGDDIQGGDIGLSNPGGFVIAGQGVKGDYVINKQNTVGGGIVDGYGNNDLGVAVWDRYKFMNISPLLDGHMFYTTAGLTDDFFSNSKDYFISESGGISLARNQTFGFTLVGLDKVYPNRNFQGGELGLSYGGNFFHRRLSVSDYFSKASYDTGRYARQILNLGNYDTYFINNRWNLVLQDNYNSYPTPYYTVTPVNVSFSNYLYANKYTNGTGLSTFIFYNRYNSQNIDLAYFGAGERYGYYNIEKNILASATVQGGYNDLINVPTIKDYFTLQPSLLLRYHTTTFRLLYNYGPNGIPTLTIFSGATPYPQLLSASLSNQYQFPGRHFVFENSVTYSYYNIYADNSVTYTPELYYFTTSGWRFKIGLDFSYNSTNIGQYGFYAFPNAEEAANSGPVVSDNIYFNIGIKKQFGIPVPKKWSKYFYKTVTFIAFLDLNGDGKKEFSEAPVDNVVVHISNGADMYEVITGDNGIGKILNLKVSKYQMVTIPLKDMKVWFQNSADSINTDIKDTVYIPFVKGVKISGGIVYHPSKFSTEQTINLQGIQITAVNIETNKSYDAVTDIHGEYNMYVPVGKYTLTMNEDWLDDRFKVAQNNFTISLSQASQNIYQSFFISEKQAPVEIKQFGSPAPAPSNNSTTHPPDEVPHH